MIEELTGKAAVLIILISWCVSSVNRCSSRERIYEYCMRTHDSVPGVCRKVKPW